MVDKPNKIIVVIRTLKGFYRWYTVSINSFYGDDVLDLFGVIFIVAAVYNVILNSDYYREWYVKEAYKKVVEFLKKYFFKN